MPQKTFLGMSEPERKKEVVIVDNRKKSQSVWESTQEWWERNSNSVYIVVGTLTILGGAGFLYNKYGPEVSVEPSQ